MTAWTPTSCADMNFLDELRKVSHLKTADHAEAIPVVLRLRGFRKGQAPPFVDFTGTGPSVNLSTGYPPRRARGQYLLGGGMLFADAGSDHGAAHSGPLSSGPSPTGSSGHLQRRPDLPPAVPFPGCPPLWHHDGSRAGGIKIDGRWAVFTSPATSTTPGRPDTAEPPAIVTQSMRLGMNIIYYASVHYLNR